MLDNPAFHLDSPLTSSCIFVVLFPILFYSTQVPKRSVSESDKLARDRRVRAAKIAATATGGVVIGVLTAGVGLLGEFGSAFLPKNKKVYINKKRGGGKISRCFSSLFVLLSHSSSSKSFADLCNP